MRWNELTEHLDLWQQTAISGPLFEGATAVRVAGQLAVTNGEAESVRAASQTRLHFVNTYGRLDVGSSRTARATTSSECPRPYAAAVSILAFASDPTIVAVNHLPYTFWLRRHYARSADLSAE